MKNVILLCILVFSSHINSQSRATLDSLTTEYNKCIKIRKDRVNCTKELFWAYQDYQFDFYRKAAKGLDSISRQKKAIECGEWVKSKDFFVAQQFLNFKKKHPSEKITSPNKVAENDAYLAFRNICDYILIRINDLLLIIESNEKK